MPLSEDEQRILQEIEKNFYDNDPAFAREVSSSTLGRNAGRNLKLAAAGFVAGLVVLILGFTESLGLGFLGFVAMLASAAVFERNVRHLGKGAMQHASRRTGTITDLFGARSRRLRARFKRR